MSSPRVFADARAALRLPSPESAFLRLVPRCRFPLRNGNRLPRHKNSIPKHQVTRMSSALKPALTMRGVAYPEVRTNYFGVGGQVRGKFMILPSAVVSVRG